MSTIVIVRKGDKAVIGSESRFSLGSIGISSKYQIGPQKLMQFGEVYVGFAGWSAMLNIFEDVMEKFPGELDFRSRKHIFKTFLFLHETIKKHHYVETREGTDQPVESSQWDCLIASPHGIFEVDSYRTVIEYERFWSSGSGKRFALGAMHAVYDTAEDPEVVARAGLSAACEFDEASGEPLVIRTVSLKHERR